MKKLVVYIDTSDRTKSIVTIEIDGKIEKVEVDTPLGSGTAVLTAIETILGKHKLTTSDITHVRVATGPGSYTGLRVGVAIANMLGHLLGVPVNNQPVGQGATPDYQQSS